MQPLTRREALKLAVTLAAGSILSVLSGKVDLEKSIEKLEQPTEELETAETVTTAGTVIVGVDPAIAYRPSDDKPYRIMHTSIGPWEPT